ncbi:Gfo/Idh/MocA family oxidoreductase [bacterium]|nr:Gfo/Idh/MocA family oxidoreductase [bacterium]
MKQTYNLGIIGMSPGNGHPYSWSAIFNGYNKKKMAKCPFPVIPEYLGKQDPKTMCIKDAQITHIWTQDRKISQQVAESSLIPNIVENMTDMIGKVDAVILARDDGENHLSMAKPFIEKDIPILIDKPLTDNAEDLKEFIQYYEKGKLIMSCSSTRYDNSILKLKGKLGRILTANAVTPKYWRTYGIHLIEGIYAVMGGGIKSVQNIGEEGKEIVHLCYIDGKHVVLQTFKEIKSDIHFAFYGEKDSEIVDSIDFFSSFKNMLSAFIKMLDSRKPSFDWHETVKIAKIVIAGRLSLKEKGRVVNLLEV